MLLPARYQSYGHFAEPECVWTRVPPSLRQTIIPFNSSISDKDGLGNEIAATEQYGLSNINAVQITFLHN